MWIKATESLGTAKQFPLPRELRKKHGEAILTRNLKETAKQLRAFLAKDLGTICKRYFAGCKGEHMLAASSFLDIRFRSRSMWCTVSFQDTRQKVLQMAFRAAEQCPDLVGRLQMQANNPANHVLAALLQQPQTKPRGRGRALAALAVPVAMVATLRNQRLPAVLVRGRRTVPACADPGASCKGHLLSQPGFVSS